MRNDPYFTTEKFNYSFAALEESKNAAIHANYGQRFRFAYERAKHILREWEKILVNAPITLKTALFFIFFVADIMVSWEMMKDVIDSGGLLSPPPGWAVLLLCLLVNVWAAVSAHFIGQGWSKDIQEWERWNFFNVTNRDMPANVATSVLWKERNRARLLSILSSLLLFLIVALIVHHRIRTLDALGDTTFFNYIITALPLAIVIGELFTGDYIWYIIKRYQIMKKRRRNRRRFLERKERCGESDQLAYKYVQLATSRGQSIEIIGDLERSMLRMKQRSQQNDSYLDPFDRRIIFIFRYSISKLPLSNTSVFGILPNGAKTEDYSTNQLGKVTMQWEGDYDNIVAVNTLGKEHLGPFQSNAEHYIEILDGVPASSNGKGPYEPAETN
ncbi:MAG: hypothetical protein ACKVT2_11730 [Saprospiraceae bacterium]